MAEQTQILQTNAERAMEANAESRRRQAEEQDAEAGSPPPNTDHLGPGGDPAEGKD